MGVVGYEHRLLLVGDNTKATNYKTFQREKCVGSSTCLRVDGRTIHVTRITGISLELTALFHTRLKCHNWEMD